MVRLIEQTLEQREARREHLMRLPGYICLAVFPGEEWYTGLVERSFSLDKSRTETQFFWTSDNAHSNFGTTHEIDGWKDAKRRKEYYEGLYPGVRIIIVDARDEDLLPVELDWEGWIDARQPAETLSGVKDKYGARNIRFTVKTDRALLV